jgi:hypothetical protein
MDKQETEALLQRMSEAAALPAHDPVRIETSRVVVAAGQEFEHQWLEMIAEDERLRLDLLHVDPPAGMRERLLALPQDTEVEQTAQTDRWWMLRAAAVISLLALGSWALFGPYEASTTPLSTDPPLAFRINQLGRDTMEHVVMHAHKPDYIQLASNDPAALAKRLDHKVPFDVQIPDFGKAFKLLGANICKVKSKDIVCTHWLKDNVRFTLVQFCRVQCDLPEEFPKQIVTRDNEPYRLNQSDHAIFWSENGSAYALIVHKTPADSPLH